MIQHAAAALAALIVAGCGSPSGPGPVADGPVVLSITPNAGGISGGTEVAIAGLRFAAGATVTIGGRPASDVNVKSSEIISARTPAAAAEGPADVVVAVGGRTGALLGGFSYQVPPANAPPVITAITVQGGRAREPANFADLGEAVMLSATVRDEETPPEQMEYLWSASLGAVSGMGAGVTWQAPADAQTPVEVTITLRVVERYGAGQIFQHEVTGTSALSLHDSARELGEMAVRFLTEFSKPQTNQDWRDIMRDFNAAACPDPGEFDAERDQVITHYTNFFMYNYNVGPASVSSDFGGRCAFRAKRGDACIAIPVFWDSTDRRNNVRAQTSGTDHLAAAYSRADSRWWLCSSDYDGHSTLGHAFYSR